MGCIFSKKRILSEIDLHTDLEKYNPIEPFNSDFEYINPIRNNNQYLYIDDDIIIKPVFI